MIVRNKKSSGGSFDSLTVQRVWEKGTLVPGYHPNNFRKDKCGALMSRTDYGNTDSKNGWEVDHIRPSARGGGDELSNLQPLQWENNRHKGDDYPNWTCYRR
jgi:hypothetical protein